MNLSRNLILILWISLITVLPVTSNAGNWVDLWLTHDQKGVKAYQSKDFKKALDTFSKSNSALARYNQGNTLAQLGKFNEAIELYSEALAIDPKNADAEFNKKLLEDFLKQQAQKNQQEQEQSEHNSSQNQESDSAENETTNTQNTTAQETQVGEEQQANEQLLMQVPDDPGGLLRQKFMRDHRRNQSG